MLRWWVALTTILENKFALALTARKVIPALHDSNHPLNECGTGRQKHARPPEMVEKTTMGETGLLAKVPPVPVIALEVQL
ncbi:hypothetical protein B0H63DRAFT_473369 [Podospora didyma]|uniref:Secreted protein n=1 Tax=Podospora didyma TaxID=330526 RepID=A0AAE0NQ52_9PEZI|nr:hypothetical protein B0H63DRAFT_473369 [Podospora didyma]